MSELFTYNQITAYKKILNSLSSYYFSHQIKFLFNLGNFFLLSVISPTCVIYSITQRWPSVDFDIPIINHIFVDILIE